MIADRAIPAVGATAETGPAVPGERPWLDQGGAGWAVAALFSFALVVGAYFTFRFGGRWSEWDTASLAQYIRVALREQTLMSPSGALYSNGYGFSAVSAFIVAFSGLDPITLLQSVYPLVSAGLVLIAWPVYRELTGSARGATLATLLLFIQPEFLFVILRGSHERVLRALLLISIWLLVRSIRHVERPALYTAHVCLFYLVVYGTIATNAFFGSSYVWALSIALIGSWFGAFLGPGLYGASAAMRRRLIYVPLLCGVLVFIFNEYIYPPAGHGLSQVTDIFERLHRLFLTTSPEGTQAPIQSYDPYAVVVDQWIDLRIYFLLSTSTYVLMVASIVIWARTGLQWLSGHGDRPTLGPWLLWLLYGAFAAQGFSSVIADRAGTLGGNLQYRSFPSFVMVAAPLVAAAVVRWRLSPPQRVLAAAALGVLALFGVIKATNEPMLSNKWTFYLPGEVAVIRFADEHLKDDGYWSDFDERLRTVHMLHSTSELATFIDPRSIAIRSFVITDVTRLRAARLSRALPPVTGEQRVYDNGSAQIYRTRARTPFQD